MTLMKLRFVLAVTALVAVVAMAVLILFFGAGLNALQAGMLGVLITGLLKETQSASSWTFDGVPDKSPAPPAPSDSTTTP